jgi:hypothetical protein
MSGFYHFLTYRVRRPNAQGSAVIDKVIGSTCTTIDDASRERCQIAKQYRPGAIVALTTHNVGTGPGCTSPRTVPPGCPES